MKSSSLKIIKKVGQLYKKHIGKVVASGFIALIITLIGIIFPVGFGRAIDFLIYGEYRYALYILMSLILLVVIREFLSYLGGIIYGNLNNIILNDLRIKMFNQLTRIPLSFYNKQKSGEIMSLFINDINAVQSVTSNTLLSIITDVFTLFAIIITLFISEWRLALISVLSILIYVGVLYREKVIQKWSKNGQEKVAVITACLSETLSGIKTIKTFAEESNTTLLFSKLSDDWLKVIKKIIRLKVLYQGVTGLITGVIPLVLFLIGMALLASGNTTIGGLISIYTLLGQLYYPCRNLSSINVIVQSGLASLSRIFSFLDIEQEQYDVSPCAHVSHIYKVEFKDVSFSYEKRKPVLCQLSFQINCGEKIAIVGESGAGKSTIVDLILKFYPPSEGMILFNEINSRKIPSIELRKQIGVVSQDVFLFHGSIRDNIKFGVPDATDNEIYMAASVAGADQFIQDLPEKYETIIGDRGLQLSVGQRQRLSIARAIIKNPSLIILDEATSALDASIQKQVQQDLYRLFSGRVCLVIAHRLSTILDCDRILVLHNGTIVESGSFPELIERRGFFWNLYSNETSEKKQT